MDVLSVVNCTLSLMLMVGWLEVSLHSKVSRTTANRENSKCRLQQRWALSGVRWINWLHLYMYTLVHIVDAVYM